MSYLFLLSKIIYIFAGCLPPFFLLFKIWIQHLKVRKYMGSLQIRMSQKIFTKQKFGRIGMQYMRAAIVRRSKRLTRTWKIKKWARKRYPQKVDSMIVQHETGSFVESCLWCSISWRAETDTNVGYGEQWTEIFLRTECRKKQRVNEIILVPLYSNDPRLEIFSLCCN